MGKENSVFGIRAVEEAIVAGKEIEKVFIKKGLQGDLFKSFLNKIREHDIPFQFVPVEKLNRITRKNHQGVIAMISPITYQNIEQLVPMLYDDGKNPFVLVLDHVTDVRNFGAIARTAECAGVHAIVVPDKGGALVNADAIKTSAGALHTIPVCRVKNLTETVSFLKNSGLRIVAATEKGAVDYAEPDYSGPVALVMGAEDKGISPDILKEADVRSRIPILGNIDSLNVSVAAGILIYEILKKQ
ncbi:23S rRNA (guanosine(2251)-2'-O)-methyltransferase RlmB [Marinilabiliaceae bacterium JC017]|nr:23S rRNA (guanosine(2251)-2'-O)-methyltransferase RlmB [Marinilabiliaceae bacterium JC017]